MRVWQSSQFFKNDFFILSLHKIYNNKLSTNPGSLGGADDQECRPLKSTRRNIPKATGKKQMFRLTRKLEFCRERSPEGK
jgi:hypothetical protein